MEDDTRKRLKACCSKLFRPLVNQLVVCDRQSATPAERHACYRISARVVGRGIKACASESQEGDEHQ